MAPGEQCGRRSAIPLAVAGYPIRPVNVDIGGGRLTMLVVDQLENYVDADALLREDDPPEPPYWIHLWTASRALARQVAGVSSWRGRRVVEVGCGLGLPGITAAVRGATVTMIDAVREALCFARLNGEQNGCSLEVVQADIRRAAPFRGRFDVCLAADATYDPVLQQGLAAFVAEHLKSDGITWCAESVRNTDDGFRRACEARGLVVAEREVREMEEGHGVPVRITEVRRP